MTQSGFLPRTADAPYVTVVALVTNTGDQAGYVNASFTLYDTSGQSAATTDNSVFARAGQQVAILSTADTTAKIARLDIRTTLTSGQADDHPEATVVASGEHVRGSTVLGSLHSNYQNGTLTSVSLVGVCTAAGKITAAGLGSTSDIGPGTTVTGSADLIGNPTGQCRLYANGIPA